MTALNAMTQSLRKTVRIVPRSRNIEAMLLIFAVGLNAFELAQIQLSVLEILRSDIWLYLLPLGCSLITSPWPRVRRLQQ